jgi:hypothetical protein
MLEAVESFREAWADPHSRHAILVHAPIALGTLGVLPLIVLAAGGFRSRVLQAVVIACFVLASAGAFMAADSGLAAAAQLRDNDSGLSVAEESAIATHERRGRIAWVWPLFPAALIATTLLPRLPRAARLFSGTTAVAAGVGVAVWFAVIGHVGGRLVYSMGLGVPPREAPAVVGDAESSPAMDE